MIFAAGLGTRLQPLTNDRPKALVELNGRPLLDHVLEKMKAAGVTRLVVNVHHYADMVEDFLNRREDCGMEILISDERNCLLDTGGGLLKARELFIPDQPVLIHNVDILSDVDLKDVMEKHIRRNADATLVVRPAHYGRVLRFNESGELKGWENQATGEQKIVDKEFYTSQTYSFCGIQVVSPQHLAHITHRGVFSIIDEYLAQARRTPLFMYPHTGLFIDLGTPESITTASAMLR